jgi:hypothetical protein
MPRSASSLNRTPKPWPSSARKLLGAGSGREARPGAFRHAADGAQRRPSGDTVRVPAPFRDSRMMRLPPAQPDSMGRLGNSRGNEPVRGNLFFRYWEGFTGSRRSKGARPGFPRSKGLACFLSKEGLQRPGRFAQPFPPAWSLDGPERCGTGRCPAAPPVPAADARLPYRPQGYAAVKDDAAGSRTETVVMTESGAGKLHHAAARTAAHKEGAAGRRTGPANTGGTRGRTPERRSPTERGEQGLGRTPCGAVALAQAPGKDAWRGRSCKRPAPRIFRARRMPSSPCAGGTCRAVRIGVKAFGQGPRSMRHG